jgi:replicative DNA helicase
VLLVAVDSLQAWSRAGAMGGPATDYDLVTAGVHAARTLALTLGGPVLLVSHRNRAGQERGGLFSSKGSGDIEYGAESVIELIRDMNAKPDRDGEVPVELKILKNRRGDAGVAIALRFCGALQRFREEPGVPVLAKGR